LETHPGWEVVAEAEDGYGAINAAMRTLRDVAILDCTLPRMNGLESARRIHQQLTGTELCMFAYSAEESTVVSALDFGVRALFLNPMQKRSFWPPWRRCRGIFPMFRVQ
jgi:DNA-binding NarL/FixJ family response regulator